MDKEIEKLEKKLRKYARLERIFQKNDIILAKDPFVKHMVKDIVGDLPITFTSEEEKATKIVLPWTTDDENNTFLHTVFNKKKIVEDKKLVKLFLPLTDKETVILAKKHNLKFEPMTKDTSVEKITDAMKKSFPDIPQTLRKSIEKIKKLAK
jgi:hypothetical protein